MKTSIRFFCLLNVALGVMCYGNRAYAVIGATTPFVSSEAESGILGGGATIVSLTSPPTSELSSPQLEASGHSYVHLGGTGQNVALVNNTGHAITALNIRYSIPDSSGGGGIDSTLNLYVSGTFRGAIAVNSHQTWVYETTANYNGMSQSPSAGTPHVFWDEVSFFVPGGAIPAGSTFTLQKDSANSAAYYNIDVVDLEAPPAPLTQPANSLSLLDFGGQANNSSFDNTAAINSWIAAAQSQGKIAWLPQGVFYVNAQSSIKPSNITIQGAGPWYSEFLYVSAAWVNGIFFHPTSTSFKNLCIDATGPNATPALQAILAGGGNWTIDNVWTKHCMLVWGSGNTCTVKNSRVNNSFGDGMNINNTQVQTCTNVLIFNNFSRGNGDDAIAVNSQVGSTPAVQNATVMNNTTVASWWANQMGLYGGKNITVASNLFLDCVKKTGIEVNNSGFGALPSVGQTAKNNTLIRCGSFGYGVDQPGIIIEGNGTNTTVNNNTITSPMFEGVQILDTWNLIFQNNLIDHPSTMGIQITSGRHGTANISFNTVQNLQSGQVAYTNQSPSTFSATVTGNSWQGGGSLANGTYKLIVRHSGLALDVTGLSTTNGSPTEQWTYNGGNNQRWTVTSLGGTTYKIVGVQSGRTLEVAGASTANGAIVDIWDSNNNANQKWNITPTDSGYYSVINVNSGKAMEVFGGVGATQPGAIVDQWSGTQFNQQWSFQAP